MVEPISLVRLQHKPTEFISDIPIFSSPAFSVEPSGTTEVLLGKVRLGCFERIEEENYCPGDMQEWSVNSFEAEPYLVAQGASAECLNESGGEVEDSPNLWSLWSLDALRTAEQVDRETSILENLEMGKPSGGLQFRTITKTAYLCTFKRCNKQFTRIYDLRRHHEGVHERKASFTCSWIDCRRHVEAFTRKDKRDEHERKIHGNTSNNKRGGRARFQNLGLDHGSQAMDVQAAALSFPVSSSWIGTEF